MAPTESGAAPAVVIIGAGGHGRVVAEVLCLSGGARPVGFLDPDPALVGASVAGLPVLGGDDRLTGLAAQGIGRVVIGVGSVGPARLRAILRRRAEDAGLALCGAVHPRAIVSTTAVLGAGTVVCAGAVVGTGARLGVNVIVNTGAIVEHDCHVGDDSHIASGAVLAGGVIIGAAAHVGAGAVLRQGIRVGNGAVVGAGAVVTKDVPPSVVVAGVPAVLLRRAEG